MPRLGTARSPFASSWKVTGLAALGAAGLLYALGTLVGGGFPRTFDVCVGGLSDGTEAWFEDVL